MNSELILRPYEPGDEAAILRAHQRVFAHVDPAHRTKSLALWRWQFEQNPAGSRCVIAVDAEGEVHGQFAGLRRRVQTEAGLVHFTQSIDSLATRSVEGGLAHTSAFVRAGELFQKQFCGAATELDQVVYGLTIPAAWRVGAKWLGYEHTRTITALAASIAELQPSSAAGFEVESCAQCPRDSDALFALVAAERGVIGVRDAQYLDWRFAAHPEQRYVFGVVREQGTLRGLGVFRRGSFAGLEGGLVCDWVMPAADESAREALLSWFRTQTVHSGAAQLIALFPDSASEWLEFQRLGFRVLPTEYILATRTFRQPFDRDYLFWRWFYTLGDTDLV